MKVGQLINDLKKFDPNSWIKLHGQGGMSVEKVVERQGNTVVLMAPTDIDTEAVLKKRFYDAAEEQEDELDFFMMLLEAGFTMKDIQTYLPDGYEYSVNFCKEHGLT